MFPNFKDFKQFELFKYLISVNVFNERFFNNRLFVMSAKVLALIKLSWQKYILYVSNYIKFIYRT